MNNIHAKIIAYIVITLFVMSCSLDNRTYSFDKKFIVAEMSIKNGYTRNKFHTPTVYHTILFSRIIDTTSYMEIEITPSIYSNLHPKDEVSIDYVMGSKGGGDKNVMTKFVIRNNTTGYIDSITNRCCITAQWITK